MNIVEAVYYLATNSDGGQNTRYPLGNKPAAVAPSPPINFAAGIPGFTNIPLSWEHNGQDLTGFELQQWILGTSTAWTPALEFPGPAVRDYDAQGLPENTHIGHRLRTVKGDLVSAWAPEVWVDTDYDTGGTTPPPGGEPLIIDDFATQPIGGKPSSLNPPTGLGSWWYEGLSSGASILVQDPSGSRALHCVCPVKYSDLRCELGYKLGKVVHKMSFEFMLYIPAGDEAWGGAAYKHKYNGVPATNCKIFRAYTNTYNNNPHKIGASIWRVDDNTSQLAMDFSYPNGATGPQGGYHTIIDSSTRGKWIKLRFDVGGCTSSINHTTTMVTYLNDVEILRHTADQYNGSDLVTYPTGYDRGYILGSFNSGFDEETIFLIDNVNIVETA